MAVSVIRGGNQSTRKKPGPATSQRLTLSHNVVGIKLLIAINVYIY